MTTVSHRLNRYMVYCKDIWCPEFILLWLTSNNNNSISSSSSSTSNNNNNKSEIVILPHACQRGNCFLIILSNGTQVTVLTQVLTVIQFLACILDQLNVSYIAACDDGFYGSQCRRQCGSGCSRNGRLCDNVNGHCTCKDGWTAPLCQGKQC